MGYSPRPGETVSFSSPEFLKLLPEMDEKMVPIDHAKVSDEQNSPVDGFQELGAYVSCFFEHYDYDKP
jgi:hypothetical protein